MPVQITTDKAVEQSTFVIQCDFTDEDGNAVAPVTLTWTLTDSDGTVINSRTAVAVSSPTSTEYIVLSGDDLALTGTAQEARYLLLEGTYDSTYGTGLPIRESVEFAIENLVAVT
uniref:Uncharacterized protein n=1 Tax=viral metagenome TaxID=1070528 RepID=A0A6M3J3J1_9ZZZZ